MAHRQLNNLFTYCRSIVNSAGQQLRGGEVLSKVLSNNDDAGRHGVLIPTEAYDFFPELIIPDKTHNQTNVFGGFDFLENTHKELAYKYYERYPERRITRLNPAFNDRLHGRRVAILLKAEHQDGTIGYYADIVREKLDADFQPLCSVLFGESIALSDGAFSIQPVDSPIFIPDDALNDLLTRFDKISEMGWIKSLREGDTGIGYTFESLAGIQENNDRKADFRGIEIKCKQIKESGAGGGKINLFQQAPCWETNLSALERIRLIGQPDLNGRYACHSQVTTTKNNIDLWLNPFATPAQIDLLKGDTRFGYWPHSILAERLKEKHSRAVFIKAKVSNTTGGKRFHYLELIYCEQPSIRRFTELVQDRRLVFEFLMSEKENGKVRNHGYPWRLSSDEYLSELFSFRVQLR
jgi:hypothetical protein